jgi:Cu/Zn superoxide dismutase
MMTVNHFDWNAMINVRFASLLHASLSCWLPRVKQRSGQRRTPPRGSVSARLAGRRGRHCAAHRDARCTGVEVTSRSTARDDPGQHGIHFHSGGCVHSGGRIRVGGGHFNPTGKKHGLFNPKARTPATSRR